MIQFDINTQELQDKLNDLSTTLSGKEMGRSIALGINLTLKQARTQSDREIRSVYNMRQKFVLNYLKISNASNGNFVGKVFFPTRPIPIAEYLKVRQTSEGVSVEIIKGKNEVIKGAFLMVSKFNNSASSSPFSVMARSNISGGSSYSGNFQFRHKRVQKSGMDLPIGATFSVSPFSGLFKDIVEKKVGEYVSENLMKNVFTLLDKNAAGLIRQSNNRGRY